MVQTGSAPVTHWKVAGPLSVVAVATNAGVNTTDKVKTSASADPLTIGISQ